MNGLTAAELRTRFPKMPERTVQMNASDVVRLGNPLPAYVTAPTDSTKAIKGDLSSSIENPTPRRVRQARAKTMNKTETDFFLHLQNLTAGKIRFNEVRFELANGLHFKPDFTVDVRQAYEAKGPWASRDAFPRLKMAARLYPEIKWFLATRAKRGGWDIQHILP